MIWKNIEILLRPRYWLRNYGTDHYLDRTINLLLDDGHKPEWVCKFTFRLATLRLWGSNYPYAFGYVFPERGSKELPSRKTALRLKRALGRASMDKAVPHFKKLLNQQGIFTE